jgi:hypothetical protein
LSAHVLYYLAKHDLAAWVRTRPGRRSLLWLAARRARAVADRLRGALGLGRAPERGDH